MTLTLPYGTFSLPDTDASAFTAAEPVGFWDLDLKPYLDRPKARSHCVDVGAHVGLYSGYWGATGMRVTAIEGHPRYLPHLCRNIDANRWQEVITVLPWFAYSRRGCLTERLEYEIFASNTWLPSADPSEGVIAVTLDECLRLLQSRVDFLKIDAQGADLHVLLGTEGIIRRDRPPILIEYEADLTKLHGHTADDYHQWAADHRYREHAINGWNCYWEPI